MNGAAGAVSFQSMNYPDHFLGPCNDSSVVDGGVEVNRLCILQTGTFPVNDASFTVVNGLSDASLYSFQSLSSGREFWSSTSSSASFLQSCVL
jgi:hypothetical protein